MQRTNTLEIGEVNQREQTETKELNRSKECRYNGYLILTKLKK